MTVEYQVIDNDNDVEVGEMVVVWKQRQTGSNSQAEKCGRVCFLIVGSETNNEPENLRSAHPKVPNSANRRIEEVRE